MNPAPRLPAEWEPQSAIMLTWPHDRSDWRDGLAGVEQVFAEIAGHVSAYQDVLIVCADGPHRRRVREYLYGSDADPDRIYLVTAPSNDCWARDHGPIGVNKGDAPLLCDFRFNGWGGKYPSGRDDAITTRLARAGVFGTTPVMPIDWVMEGGSIDTDGRGTVLTTRSCLLDPGRNGPISAARVEAELGRHLGLRRFLWLEHGSLSGDDTDGHVDMLARFCNRDTIAYAGCSSPLDRNHESLQALATEIHGLRQVDGRPYRLIELPSPGPILAPDGAQLPASYANFLITNEKILVPVYGSPADGLAQALLQESFSRREVVGIDCLPLIRQYGALHCVTMQIPAGIPVHD